MTLDEFVAVVLIVALVPVAIIQWMGLIVAITAFRPVCNGR